MNTYLTETESAEREALIRKKNRKWLALLLTFAVLVAVGGGMFLYHFGINTKEIYH